MDDWGSSGTDLPMVPLYAKRVGPAVLPPWAGHRCLPDTNSRGGGVAICCRRRGGFGRAADHGPVGRDALSYARNMHDIALTVF